MKATNLQLSLLSLRLGVFIVFFVWTLDKFLDPVHTARVWSHFYKIDDVDNMVSYIVGGIQMAILLAFLCGIKKRLSYGVILIMHTISTVSTWKYLIAPYAEPRDILFMTAIPMLSACFALYMMRDEDTLLTVSK